MQALADRHDMHLLVGRITKAEAAYHNSALRFSPGGAMQTYYKRALWGLDQDNFVPGESDGVFEIDAFRVGVRICYEIRFPEYFRELYQAGPDLNCVLFYDVATAVQPDRYALIRAHLQTRAVENVAPFLTANVTAPYQTAPTCMIGKSGSILHELPADTEGLLIHDFHKDSDNFGETGRRVISDMLIHSGT